MDRPITPVADPQERALTFMLDALGLPPAPDEVRLATRVVELEHTVTALLAENRQLRREVIELQHELDPDAVALEAFDREVDSRIEAARERGADLPRPLHRHERSIP
jgi:predicted RNase H-like nuclease (RuvC/YqgF family)